MLKVLGLHIHGSQSAAALLVDGQVRAAVAEERLNRIKHSRTFPAKAISYCLEVAGLDDLQELDAIAVAWNPVENMRNINLRGFTDWRRYDPEWLYIAPNHLLTMAGPHSFPGDVARLNMNLSGKAPIYFVNHHACHAAHAICQSSFSDGAFAIVDEYGEVDSVTIGSFDREGARVIDRVRYPHSLGVFYAALTEFLGFAPNSDEWKVMGAAAFGKCARFVDALSEVLQWDAASGRWVLDQRYVEHANMKRGGYCSEDLARLLGVRPRIAAEPLEQVHFDLAAAAQEVFERRLFQLLERLATLTGKTTLAASGGCFMNSLANGRIVGNTPFRQVFIPYAAADNGGAMGAALHVHHYVCKQPRRVPLSPPTPFLGPSYSVADIERVLKTCKVRYQPVDDPAEAGAQMLAKGQLVGWFQGRMEFGERALGARSILGDPRDPGVKDKVNSAVKYRESFRPFAPSVIESAAATYFDMPPGVRVPYMEQVYPVREEFRRKLPGITHADGTARLQTVSEADNPSYYRLLEAFGRHTGMPVVLNTSFNIKDEPIVASPADALRTFFSCGLDALLMENLLVLK